MPEAIVKCPICSTDMQKKQVPPALVIDYCDAHGVWLDAGELETMLQSAEKDLPATSGGNPAATGGADSMLKDAGRQLGRSALFGVGASVGHRLVGGILDGLFRK